MDSRSAIAGTFPFIPQGTGGFGSPRHLNSLPASPVTQIDARVNPAAMQAP